MAPLLARIRRHLMARLRLPRPHAAQQRVIDERKRFNVLACGRRWGKTELGMDRLINAALPGKPVAWFAPSYKLLAPVWRELQTRLRPVTRDCNQAERRLELKGGGSLEMWSLDSPDSGRGRAYAAVVLDEVALIPDFEHAWQESIRPQLTDHSGQRLVSVHAAGCEQLLPHAVSAWAGSIAERMALLADAHRCESVYRCRGDRVGARRYDGPCFRAGI